MQNESKPKTGYVCSWKQIGTLTTKFEKPQGYLIRSVEFKNGKNSIFIKKSMYSVYPLIVNLTFPDKKTSDIAKSKLLQKYPSLHQSVGTDIIQLNIEQWNKDFVHPFLFDIVHLFQTKDEEQLLSALEEEMEKFATIQPWEKEMVEQKSNQIWSHVESFQFKPYDSITLFSLFKTSLDNPIQNISMKYVQEIIYITVDGTIQLNTIKNVKKRSSTSWIIECHCAEARDVVKQICEQDNTGLLELLNTELDILDKILTKTELVSSWK